MALGSLTWVTDAFCELLSIPRIVTPTGRGGVEIVQRGDCATDPMAVAFLIAGD
jgi:hypothetical protein